MHDEQYEAVRKQVVLRLTLRVTFFVNLIFGLLVVAAIAQDLSQGDPDIIGVAFFIFFWLTGLLLHGAFAFPLASRFIDHATASNWTTTANWWRLWTKGRLQIEGMDESRSPGQQM